MSQKFNAYEWLNDVSSAEGAFTALDQFTADERAMRRFMGPKPKPPSNPDNDAQISALVEQLNWNRKRSGIENAREIYRRQTIVLVATLFESCSADFLSVLFSVKPELMQEFLVARDDRRARVEFSLIANSDTKEELMEALAERAVARAVGLPYPKLLERLEKLTKTEMEEGLEKALSELLDHRNRIVHVHEANAKGSILHDTILAAFNILRSFISYLEQAGTKSGIPVVSYSSLLGKLSGLAIRPKKRV